MRDGARSRVERPPAPRVRHGSRDVEVLKSMQRRSRAREGPEEHANGEPRRGTSAGSRVAPPRQRGKDKTRTVNSSREEDKERPKRARLGEGYKKISLGMRRERLRCAQRTQPIFVCIAKQGHAPQKEVHLAPPAHPRLLPWPGAVGYPHAGVNAATEPLRTRASHAPRHTRHLSHWHFMTDAPTPGCEPAMRPGGPVIASATEDPENDTSFTAPSCLGIRSARIQLC